LKVGVNIPWFGGSYCWDMGFNEFSAKRFWKKDDGEDWKNFDFHYPDRLGATTLCPLLLKNVQVLHQTFSVLCGNINIARLWLFEGLEGLQFNNDLEVIGIDKIAFLPNLQAVLNAAASNGFRLYLTLLNPWDAKVNPYDIKYTGQKAEAWLIRQETKSKALLNILNDSNNSFISNVISPLMSQIANHPGLFGIDIANETEAFWEGKLQVPKTSERTVVNDFVIPVCTAIKKFSPKIHVTTSFMRQRNAYEYSQYFDNIDLHHYVNTPADATNVMRSINNSPKPAIIGEYGVHKNKIGSAQNEYETLASGLKAAYNNNNNIDTVLLWGLDSFHPENVSRILLHLRQYVYSQKKEVC
jgi:hypothetical protein